MDNRTWKLQNTYAALPPLFYTKQRPIPVRAPQLVIFNDALADSLGVPMHTEIFGGNEIPPGAEPLAQAYGGHQFGHFTMLGDGRAVLLGEQVTATGERFDIQLKGSGKTPYSRGGDGRAALGPMLREYIISEAMYALGIPTTRSLAVVKTGEMVEREARLQGAILTRVAKSHIRVGTFEYAARFGTPKDVHSLADYTIARHFPELAGEENRYLLLLQQVIEGQAALIAQWQLVGFIHGVMNTDNMTVSGETIDYGPCAFMDAYHPATVFSSIDTHGRYAYENQPKMAAWNLARLAETLLPLLSTDKDRAVALAQQAVDQFHGLFKAHWLKGMAAKLGMFHVEAGDEGLIDTFLELLQRHGADYSKTFQALTLDEKEGQALFSCPDYEVWHQRWQSRLSRQGQPESARKELMKRHNPALIPRNHLVEAALTAAQGGDLDSLHSLLHALKQPYAYTPQQQALSALPPPEFCNYKTFCGT